MATTLLSNITEGSVIKLNENGSPVDFYVAKHNYEPELNGVGRTLLVRKNFFDKRAYTGTGNSYKDGALDKWLNGEYKALLDPAIQTLIGATTFYYTIGYGNTTLTTLSRGVFTLSLTELGGENSYANVEGSVLPISSTLREALYNGYEDWQWTRTAHKTMTGYAFAVYSGGSNSAHECTMPQGSRPVFTLPAAATYISDNGKVEANVPTISGEDASFGSQHADFNIAYAVSTTDSSAATVTEKVDDTVIRTYTAQSGAAQSMTVAIADLAAGEHTVTITADLNGATAERRYAIVVSSILMAYDETELGTKNADFSIPYSAVENTDAEVTITEYLDGALKRRYTAASGSKQSMDIAIGYLVDGEHIATIQAESGGETTSATFTFAVAAHHLPPYGTIQELQDHEGAPVLPVTLARAVLTDSGRSVEAALEHIFEVATAELVD